MNDIWQQLDRDGDGRLKGKDTSAFVTMAYNAATDTIKEEEKLLEQYGYRLATDNVGASVPGQRFSRDITAAKQAASEKLHEAGESIHKQMTSPSLQERMMDRLHQSAWQKQKTTSGSDEGGSNQHQEESGVFNWLKNLFSENEQGQGTGINVAATEVAATELTPGMLAGKDLKPVEMGEGAKEIYEQLRGMETESQSGTQTQPAQPQQQEQGPPNTLLDIYSFSAKKQPVQDAQVTGTGATQPNPAHRPEPQRKSGQRQENPLLAEMTSRPVAEMTSRPEPARDAQPDTQPSASGMTTGMAAGTGMTQQPAHPEPQTRESGQRQENPLLREIIEPKNPDEMLDE
jgi:hypothetical protein